MLKNCLKNKGYKVIPLQRTAIGHLAVTVLLNGRQVDFIVDTGAASTVMDIDYAREMKLPMVETGLQGGGIGTSQLRIFRLELDEAKMGDLLLKDLSLYAVDFTHVKESLKRKGETKFPAGVIGADVFIRHKAVIDYGSRQLYLN